MHLRLRDFKIVSENNSALFKINSQLKLCGEKNHRRRHVRKNFYYISCLKCALAITISCLLVAKQNNELLMRNHQSCPTRFEPFLEVNAILSQTRGHGKG